MGVTKSFSLSKHYSAKENQTTLLVYTLKSMLPTLCAYFVATFFYLTSHEQIGLDYNVLLTSLLSFSASRPFYFILYYILLSLWAPILFTLIKYVLTKYDHQIRFFLLIITLVIIWTIGYISINRIDIFGQSYLFVYSVGLLLGQLKEYEVKKIYFIPSFMVLLFGLISTKNFYWAKVAGVYDYSKGIDFLCPKLQMNPPNISIILYSFGVIAVAWFLFDICNRSKAVFPHILGNFFNILGKYSLDIYLWHLYIQAYLNRYFGNMNKNILKWMIYYTCMFGIPIVIRYLYNIIKNKVYTILGE